MRQWSAARWLPILGWLPGYRREDAAADAVAAAIVTVMAIPQSLAYAMLAGLPPQAGLYASILPLFAYALFGSSSVLSVGPVAVISLLTASAVSAVADIGSPEYLAATLVLAAAVGAVLLLMGVLRLGWIANYLSYPVLSGFISASAVLIAASQLTHVLGVPISGDGLVALLGSALQQLPRAHGPTVILAAAAIAFLFAAHRYGRAFLQALGLRAGVAGLLSSASSVVVVLLAIVVVAVADLVEAGVAIVGAIPRALPPLTMPALEPALWRELLPAAVMIALIGFVQSISMAQMLAAKRRERVQANQELLGLGAANLAAAISGGLPVTGGVARSVVGFAIGARTPMTGVFSAAGVALVVLYLTPLFYYLPRAVLAAIIIVAVLPLVDLKAIRRTFIYSKADFMAMAITIALVLLAGVEVGVMAGVGLSIALFLWKTSHPHVAVVGLVPGTEHFRNVRRHTVITSPQVLSVRIDESLYFANARYLVDVIYDEAVRQPTVRHVVLMCTGINHIDASALESLDELVLRLADAGVKLHLAEVKGPVMDRLERSEFPTRLTGRVFLTQYQALTELDASVAAQAKAAS